MTCKFDLSHGYYSVSVLSSFLFRKKRNFYDYDVVIISPYLIPFKIIEVEDLDVSSVLLLRTEEGVGTEASFFHYFKGIRLAGFGFIETFFHAFAKYFARLLLVSTNVFHEKYLFMGDTDYDEDIRDSIKNLLSILGRDAELNNKVVFFTQPYSKDEFNCSRFFVDFLTRCKNSFDLEFVVKPHPRDLFDYEGYGFDVSRGSITEFYEFKDSILITMSSTSLVTANLFGSPLKCYFVESNLFNALSGSMKKRFYSIAERLYV